MAYRCTTFLFENSNHQYDRLLFHTIQNIKIACPHRQTTSSNTFLNFHLISYRSSRYTLTSFISASTISFISADSHANREIFSSSFICSSSTSACIAISIFNSAIFFSAASISASQACFTARYCFRSASSMIYRS